jgi:hypothetical protein
MKRKIHGLAHASQQPPDVPDGVYLVRVESVRFEREKTRPSYRLQFSILAPSDRGGQSIIGRIWCTPKALWKLSWFLRDFGYDQDLLGHDEIDDKRLVGLRGVLKVSHTTVNGRLFTNLDAFAPAEAWEDLPKPPRGEEPIREAAS